jgi:D-alanine-D-alanine ligase
MASSSGRTGCDIAVLVDQEIGSRGGNGRFIVDSGSMEAYVLHALKKQHAAVEVVPFDPQITPTIAELRALEPRLVFNLTEWVDGDRRLDAAIAGVLEMMNLCYTGAGPDGMQLARDKALAKEIVAGLGIAVPAHTLVNGTRPVVGALRFPLIVKPQFGDASDRIANGALVRTESQLLKRLQSIRKHSHEALLCEEFVSGRDLFVALLGNEPRVMPPLELVIGRSSARAPRFATFKVKHDARYRRRWGIRYRRAVLGQAQLRAVHEASRRIFHALKLRDYARIDYRLTPDGRLVFLEANPNPDLARHTFGHDVCFAGVPYAQLIGSIVSAALARSEQGER